MTRFRGDDPQAELADRLDEDFDRALGDAADLATQISAEFGTMSGSFVAYLGEARAAAIAALATLDGVDAADMAAIRWIQLQLRAYKSATEFAIRHLKGYAAPDDSREAPDGQTANSEDDY